MLGLRKIVFYIFALIYLILCPLIVARMLGFVINPMTHRLVMTGLVYVSTNPPDAAVYIDGRQSHQKTPAVLRDLTPGKHFIRIELEHYNDWERNVPIVGKKATVLANILLIPQEWPIKIISNRPYQNIFIAGQDILIATNHLLKNIDIFRTTASVRDHPASLFSRNSVYVDGELLRLYTSPQSPFILLEANIKNKHKFLWVNLKENPPLIEDISDLLGGIPTLIAWDNADNENIFAFYPANIYRINVKDKAIFHQSTESLPKSLNRSAQNQQERFLINNKNDLLIRKGKWVRLYPKENFGTPQVYDVAQSRPSTHMYFEEKNGELFYLDDGTGNLCAAQILKNPNYEISLF